ncbi:MAG: ROK family protein [Alphaproteobacteria bacterium]|nr:ROK family protein [Alphaproteobacteria bacterium]
MSEGSLTLAIDIGGTRLKAGVLDDRAEFVAGPARVNTPDPATPDAVIGALIGIIATLGPFERVSVGFPGAVRKGTVLTAPNLRAEAWQRFPLSAELARRLGRPVRLLNDASVQGLGVIAAIGLECVITLGTGFGFALFEDGMLAPHLELGQHIARGKKTYDEYLGNAAFAKVGKHKWNRRLKRALDAMATLLNYDALYIGGGNAKHVTLALPDTIRTVSNEAGITGGVRLWDARYDRTFPEKGLEPEGERQPRIITPAARGG